MITIEKAKGKQTTIFVTSGSSGISLTINKKSRSIYVSGWYDSFVGMEGGEISIDDLLALFDKGGER